MTIGSLAYWLMVTKSIKDISKLGLALYLLFSIPYAFGAVKHINGAFDLSIGPTYETKIIEKKIERISRRRFKLFCLTLEPWGSRKKTNELYISRDDYNSVSEGNNIEIHTGSGFLGIDWVRKVTQVEDV